MFSSRPFLGSNQGNPHTERQLWYLHYVLGASPRDLAQYAHDPDTYKSTLEDEVNWMTAGSIFRIFRDPTSHDYLFTTVPSSTTRTEFERKVASIRVAELLREKPDVVMETGPSALDGSGPDMFMYANCVSAQDSVWWEIK